MTAAEQTHKEIMRIVCKMLSGSRPSPAERERLADLAGFYRVKRGAPRKDKMNLPRFTDADFATAESMKRLCEKIIHKPIWINPSPLQEGRKRGSRDERVIDRQKKIAESVQKAIGAGMRPMQAYLGNATPSSRTDKNGHETTKSVVLRDVKAGRKMIAAEEQIHEQLLGVADSLRQVWEKHTNNPAE